MRGACWMGCGSLAGIDTGASSQIDISRWMKNNERHGAWTSGLHAYSVDLWTTYYRVDNDENTMILILSPRNSPSLIAERNPDHYTYCRYY